MCFGSTEGNDVSAMIKSTSWVSMLQDEEAKTLKIGDLLVLPDCGLFPSFSSPFSR